MPSQVGDTISTPSDAVQGNKTGAPGVSDTRDDEVVFLYSVPLQQQPSSPSSRRSAMADNVASRHAKSVERNNNPPHGPRKTKKGPKKKVCKASPSSTIPTAIRDRLVLLGFARQSKARVYGSFGKAGKFECRADVELSGQATDPGPTTSLAPISQKEIAYRPRYQGLSYRRVQEKVRHRLMTAKQEDSHGEI
jgi:hypothetical protein